MTIAELQAEYERTAAALGDLTIAIAAAEQDANEARAEAAEVTDGEGVLMAMAEERAAMNRATLIRRNRAATQKRLADLSIALMKAQDDATRQVISTAKEDAGARLLTVYRAVIAARDDIYAAQRAAGVYPPNSPLDRVCAGIEGALVAAGGSATPDSSMSVTVRYGDFQYTRRPIGYVAPTPAPRRERRPLLTAMQESLASLNRYNRQHAHEFEE